MRLRFAGLGLGLSFLLSVTGCTAAFTTAPIAPLGSGSITSPGYDADIDLGSVVSGTATSSQVLYIFRTVPTKMAGDLNPGIFGLDMLERAKAGAVYNALASGGDVLIAPRYEVTESRSLFSRSVTVKVTGFKGTVKGIKKKVGE